MTSWPRTDVNHGMGGMDRAAFKAWLNANSAGPGGRMDIVGLVAEGDAVVARFTYAITLPNGEKISARGLTWYRLVDGRIAEDDAITSPDLMQAFAAQPPPTALTDAAAGALTARKVGDG